MSGPWDWVAQLYHNFFVETVAKVVAKPVVDVTNSSGTKWVGELISSVERIWQCVDGRYSTIIPDF
jgi:hypothetical protein